jgi:uncharacterized protein YegP (UPF0339 family)
VKRHLALWLVVLSIVAGGFVLAGFSHRALAADDAEKKSGATFEVYKDKAGDFRWRLRTTNTQVIASSGQMFSSKQTCMESIESVKKNAATAEVKEVEEEAAPAAKE